MFFALVLFRLLCFVLVIFKDAVTHKTYSPVLAAVTRYTHSKMHNHRAMHRGGAIEQC